MSDRPDLDKAIKIAQAGGLKITGGKYAPDNSLMSADKEHLLSPGYGTETHCSCGKTFWATVKAQQHQEWHLKLAIAQHDAELKQKLMDALPKPPDIDEGFLLDGYTQALADAIEAIQSIFGDT